MSIDTISIEPNPTYPFGVLAPEEISRTPHRPLGKLSEFAAIELPSAIAAVRSDNMNVSEIATQINELAGGIQDFEKLDAHDLPLALFDVTSLASALRVLRSEHASAPKDNGTPALERLIKNLARQRGLVPYLSYEGLIFANPIDTDPRTFLDGDKGRQELLFYKMHALIETEFRRHLPAALDVIKARNSSAQALPPTLILQGLDSLYIALTRVSGYMRQFHTLLPKHKDGAFHTARPFWNANEKYQGPSGKFSAGYFLMDAMLSGRDPAMKQFLKTKLHELAYYPNTSLAMDGFSGQDDMLDVFSAVQYGHDLTSMSREIQDRDVQARSQEVLGIAENNRKIHIGLAAGFLPEGFRNGESGTGEQAMSMKEYLAQPLAAYASLRLAPTTPNTSRATEEQRGIPHVEIAPGYSISRVIKGEWQLSRGHLLSETINRNAAIDDTLTFVHRGINTLDFGDIYVGVEELVGDCLRKLQEQYGNVARAMIRLHTKYVPDADQLATHSFEDVQRIINRSRQRLGVDVLDLVQFHWWDYEVQGYVDALMHLQRLQREGKIKLLGVTNFDVPRLQEFVDAGVTPSSIQLQYSVLDHRPSNGMTDFCKTHNIAMLCYGTVAGGFLSEKYLGIPEPSPPYKNRSLAKYKLIIDEFGGWGLFQELLLALKKVAEKYDVSLATIASAYVLSRPQVAGVIVGAHDTSHLEDNIAIGNVILRSDDIETIECVTRRASGPKGEVYDLERNSPRHSSIMHKTNNKA